MAGEINWKSKYQELKNKYMESVDMAFRLGYEQGGQEATQAAQQQQTQQIQGMQQSSTGSQEDPDAQPGQNGNGATMPAGPGLGIQDSTTQSENPAGTELDQHIQKLESMVNKSEEIQATITGLKSLQKSMQLKHEMKKSAQTIPAIAKALHKPAFKMSQHANHNLSSNAKQAVNMQQKIVEDIMQKWEQEESGAKQDILAQLGIEGLTKKEK